MLDKSFQKQCQENRKWLVLINMIKPVKEAWEWRQVSLCIVLLLFVHQVPLGIVLTGEKKNDEMVQILETSTPIHSNCNNKGSVMWEGVQEPVDVITDEFDHTTLGIHVTDVYTSNYPCNCLNYTVQVVTESCKNMRVQSVSKAMQKKRQGVDG